MAALYNKLSQPELKKLLFEEDFKRITISFYRYFFIEDPIDFRNDLYRMLNDRKVFGRIYLAKEGINAQISVPEAEFENFKLELNAVPGLENIRLNRAVDDDGKSFWVLKIKVRNKIVADGIEDTDFDMANKGRYVNAELFNKLTKEEDTLVIDMRNHYEFEVGHFEKALEIPSDTFREQLPMAADMFKENKEKNIIMYCTGGIRCEKASAFMLHRGFKNVFHLEGGIINYVNEVKAKGLQNKFIGKNFVFDNRLGERVTEEIISHCHQCQAIADTHTNCLNEGCHLLFIQCDNCKEEYNGCCSEDCQDILALPPEERKILRRGIDKGNMVFNKSKQRLRPLLDSKK